MSAASDRERVLEEVRDERRRQDEKWGEQNHPDGTGGLGRLASAHAARLACQSNAERGEVTYLDILAEEVAEAFAESDPGRLRAELIQVAAVAVAWVEAIDRRTATSWDLPIHRTEANYGVICSTCDGGGCLDCTDPA